MNVMLSSILKELKNHVPLTILGAAAGIVFMVCFRNMSSERAHDMFYVFHPGHVFLSALTTASMYEIYRQRRPRRSHRLLAMLALGYVGAIGIATLSDSVVPYLGETLLNLPGREMHLGFIEHWWLINPVAILGVLIAYFRPTTKIPHLGHVLLSTWASLFHVMTALGNDATLPLYAGIFVFLFLAVWLPCCVSDIAFPLLFVPERATDPASP